MRFILKLRSGDALIFLDQKPPRFGLTVSGMRPGTLPYPAGKLSAAVTFAVVANGSPQCHAYLRCGWFPGLLLPKPCRSRCIYPISDWQEYREIFLPWPYEHSLCFHACFAWHFSRIRGLYDLKLSRRSGSPFAILNFCYGSILPMLQNFGIDLKLDIPNFRENHRLP